MTDKNLIESFIAEKKLALAGASQGGKKFGNAIQKELQGKGYELFLIHPTAKEINGIVCYPDLSSLPEQVGGLVNVVQPEQTEKLVQQAYEAGVNKIWMQQGSASEKAIEYCRDKEMDVIHGECILMFAQPQGLHKFHHLLWGLFGKLPKAHSSAHTH